jgi:Flp pilus assembly protein TadB
MRMVLWGAVVAVASVLAFLLLDPVLAAFVVILLVTGAVVAVLARDWDQHSTYEERELARARRRAVKWDRNEAARDRDRARWEAHRARQSGTTGRPPAER